MKTEHTAMVLVCLATVLPACEGAAPGASPSGVQVVGRGLIVGSGAQCRPSPFPTTSVNFYVDANFLSTCALVDLSDDIGFGPGNFPHGVAGLPNDAVTSIDVGNSVEVVIRADDALSGQGLLMRSSTGSLTFPSFNYPDGSTSNDTMTSFYIQRRNENCQVVGAGQVCLFQDHQFNGNAVGGSERGVGLYPTTLHLGIQNDSVSSMKVGSGVVASICRDTNFQNCAGMIPGDYALVTQLPIGNDSLSSMQVLGSCRERGGGNRCGAISSSGACSCAPSCRQAGNCCFDTADVCGF
jgi:hypothetical protein